MGVSLGASVMLCPVSGVSASDHLADVSGNTRDFSLKWRIGT